MSLKSFHLVFIAVSTLMSLGVALWAADAWRHDGSPSWIALGVVALAGGGSLVVYGNRFLQKARRLGLAALLVGAVLGLPSEALACPACVGNTDSILRTGMNNGILALLGVIGFVAGCFAWFFVSLMRRANAAAMVPAPTGHGTRFGAQVQEGSF